MRVHDGQVTVKYPELYYVEMRKFCNDIIDNYIIPKRMNDKCVEAFMAFQYKKNEKQIYKRLEEVYGNVMPFNKYYWLLYGFVFRTVRFIYNKMLKK